MASDRESTTDWQDTESSADDDMDYELATEESTDQSQADDDVEDEDGTTTLYFDAESGRLYTEDNVNIQQDDDDEEEDEDEEGNEEQEEGSGSHTPRGEPPGTARTITISQRQIFQLLRQAGLHGIFQPSVGGSITTRSRARGQHVALEEDDEEEEDDDEYESNWFGYGRARTRRSRNFEGERWPKVPSEQGQKLMASGSFGANDRCDHSACGAPFDTNVQNKRRRLSRRLFDRELGTGGYGRSRALSSLSAQELIPEGEADMIVNMNQRCYSGQFSDDGSFYFACGQDFKVRMYDTSNPFDWKYYKTVNYYGGSWTITDASLSPDNKLLAYSSIRSAVCLARTDPTETSDPLMLDFANMGDRHEHGHFGIWSLRFSGDGTEIVAGTSNDSVYVYDLEAQRSILRIKGHTEDVNAVCFGDKMSPHILYSGSDDTTLKIWDRRSLGSMRPAGMFLGHTEGITYVDSKGDGRYVVSNAKDQTCKLWDLRRMISTDVAEKLDPRDFSTGYDYRFANYDQANHIPHPHDCSLVTFRGHRVLKTLIRCHFSPALSTDQRYVYSGSHDGQIWIWNLDGTKKATINVLKATRGTRPAGDINYSDHYGDSSRSGAWKTIVRDCAWHPSAPVIAATSWNGWDHQHGTCTVHSWNDGVDVDEVGDKSELREASHGRRSLGATPMGARVTAQLAHEQHYYAEGRIRPSQRSRHAARLRSQLGLADDESDFLDGEE